jgi:hypothetical protein
MKLSRRNFFVGVVAGAAASVVAGKMTKPAAHAPNSRPKGSAYELSAHIRNYYRTTKV